MEATFSWWLLLVLMWTCSALVHAAGATAVLSSTSHGDEPDTHGAPVTRAGDEPAGDVRAAMERAVRDMLRHELGGSLEPFTRAEYRLDTHLVVTTELLMHQLTATTKLLALRLNTERKAMEEMEQIHNKIRNMENDLKRYRDMEVTTSKKTNDKLESPIKENLILDAIQHIGTKIDILESHSNKKVQELADKIEVKTKQIEHRLADIESFTKAEIHDVKNVLNKNYINLASNAFLQVNTTHTDVCDVYVPSNLQINDVGWKDSERPEKDEFDQHITDETGCRYRGVGWQEGLLPLKEDTFNGALEWQLAVRADGGAKFYIKWGEDQGYIIDAVVNYKNSVVTMISERSSRQFQYLDTPGLLSRRRYVPLTLRLDSDSVSLHKSCDSSLVMEHKHPLLPPLGTRVELLYALGQAYGGKVLYECPRSAGNVAYNRFM